MLKCPWYYDFEDLFHDHPNITASGLVESERLDREAGYKVPATRNDDEEEEKTDVANIEDGDMSHSPISWAESNRGKKFNFIFFMQIN